MPALRPISNPYRAQIIAWRTLARAASWSEFAERTGLQRVYIHRLLRGERLYDDERHDAFVARVAAGLNVSPSKLAATLAAMIAAESGARP